MGNWIWEREKEKKAILHTLAIDTAVMDRTSPGTPPSPYLK